MVSSPIDGYGSGSLGASFFPRIQELREALGAAHGAPGTKSRWLILPSAFMAPPAGTEWGYG